MGKRICNSKSKESGQKKKGLATVSAAALSPRVQINATLEEAIATLELGNSLGVAFSAPNAVVLERLQELEGEEA
ncbi:hypothetical protein V6N13_013144 [Hibiscus sabdariffa]